MVFCKLFFLRLFFFFFPSDKTLPSFFPLKWLLWSLGWGVCDRQISLGCGCRQLSPFGNGLLASTGGFQMDADMWELIQFVTYIGVWRGVGFSLLFSLSPCNKNTERVFLVLQLQVIMLFLN